LRPVREGDRGPAVEDVQRRLAVLDYDVGPTGIDGVFHRITLQAVCAFQVDQELGEDGVVGPETWAALIDATFELGDRLLYLRYPFLHGRDVQALQGILNILGFACGPLDRIFGAFTERAVRDFQLNTGQLSDGIVGSETARTLENLRHVWEGKSPEAPAACTVAPVRAAEVLATVRVTVVGIDAPGMEVACRVANLARAVQPEAVVEAVSPDDVTDATVVLEIAAQLSKTHEGPVVTAREDDEGSLAKRLMTAIEADGGPVAVVLVGVLSDDERRLQRTAVMLLDGVCAALV